jgi:hypothetical protein
MPRLASDVEWLARQGFIGPLGDPAAALAGRRRRASGSARALGRAALEKLKKYEALGPCFAPTEQMNKLAAERRGFYG